jgi:hypothetical protein
MELGMFGGLKTETTNFLRYNVNIAAHWINLRKGLQLYQEILKSTLLKLASSHRVRYIWKESTRLNGDDVNKVLPYWPKIISLLINEQTLNEKYRTHFASLTEQRKQVLKDYFKIDDKKIQGRQTSKHFLTLQDGTILKLLWYHYIVLHNWLSHPGNYAVSQGF